MSQSPFINPLPPAVGAATVVVLVGMDGSKTSWDALSWACGEVRRLRGRAVAVFVSSSVVSRLGASAFIGALPFDYDWSDSTATERADTLRRDVERYAADQHVGLTFVHARGDAASELLRLAAVLRADQIVVGRSVRARHYLRGSLGRRLVGKRKAPVVVVVP